MAQKTIFVSSIVKKYVMALTGLFLCLFVTGHLAGNLQLLNCDIEAARTAFNEYAEFMTTNPLIKIMSIVTAIGVSLHIVDGFYMWWQNRQARPVKYAMNKSEKNTDWASRNMALLGTILLVFLMVHLYQFKFQMVTGGVGEDANGLKDLYSLTVRTFQNGTEGLIYTIFYALSMLALGFHLSHGFASAFQSLGLNHVKYMPTINIASKMFGLVMAFSFAAIPLFARFFLDKV